MTEFLTLLIGGGTMALLASGAVACLFIAEWSWKDRLQSCAAALTGATIWGVLFFSGTDLVRASLFYLPGPVREVFIWLARL